VLNPSIERPKPIEAPEDFRPFQEEMQAFAAEQVAPHAALIDRSEHIPEPVTRALSDAGLLASGLPEEFGGSEGSTGNSVGAVIRHGLMHEALGSASASVQGLVNVHHMAGSTIARWGTKEQKMRWLPRLAAGTTLAAFAITEPNVGSDAGAVETRAERSGGDHVVSGSKCWITCGQNADLFVLLAGSANGPLAFLLPKATPGLVVEPISGMLGCRGYALAKLHLHECRLPGDHLLGRAPFGLTHVAATGLDAGRYNLAWGCVGLARACLDAAFDYSRKRKQFGSALAQFQLVQRMISRMMTDHHAARLMCWHAGLMRGRKDTSAIKETTMAKYFASQMVNRVAYDAVQIHGAHGCGPELPIERYLRDARIMEIIEGSTQVLETAIAHYGYRERVS
jgi:alkylation response protein AidB-like acyl-CoA dehydrogenase